MKNILHTKLIRPKVKNVIRISENINSKLDRILTNKLTTVKGGAAAGKSTLISDFLKDKNNYMWFSLDKSCDDLSTFWIYVLYGLKDNIKNTEFYSDKINPLVNREDIYDVIYSIINDLIECSELIIVLDDFQYIADEFLIKTIQFFIENSSENIHFIIISRVDIPIYTGDMLIKDGVLNINGEDFKFSYESIKKFISESTNNEADRKTIENIYSVSEGWIGAVKLILALSDNKSIQNIPKNNEVFIDYMTNEIIKCLTKEETQFLILTSLVTYVNPESYYELYHKDGIKIMKQLLKKNMFITVIDEEKGIYRYHNILREYLLGLFNRYDQNIKNETILKTASYLIKNKNYDEAMNIFITYKKYDQSLKLLRNDGEKILTIKFVNEFPIQYYSQNIDLMMISMFYNYLNFDYSRINYIISGIKKFRCSEQLKICIKLCNVLLGNSNDCSFDEKNKIIDGDYNILTKLIFCILVSFVLAKIGDCSRSLEFIKLTEKLNKEMNNKNIYVIEQYSKAIILEKMGRLCESEKIYYKIDEYLKDKEYNSCFDILKNIALPGIFIKQCKYQKAEILLKNAEELIKKCTKKQINIVQQNNVYYNFAEVMYIKGDIKECEKFLDMIDKNSRSDNTHILMLSLKIMLLSLENKITEKEYDEYISLYKHFYNDVDESSEIQITYGQVLFMKNKYKESLELFNKIIFISRKNKIIYMLICALLWKSIILYKLKNVDKREILNNLKEALFYSRDEEILFPYYKIRRYISEIILKFKDELIEDKDNKRFLKVILKTLDISSKAHNTIKEELSEREKEVLSCIADGNTNKEISQKLFISVSTVKTHIINIYSKLHIKNRAEAVNAARKIL